MAKKEKAATGASGTMLDIPVGQLVRSPYNRKVDEKHGEFLSLCESVRIAGVSVPIQVRPDGKGRFQIVDGERRWLASKKAGHPTVLAVAREMTDLEARSITALSNLYREPLPPLEEGRMVAELLEQAGGDAAAVASTLGCTEVSVRQRAHLSKLSPSWIEALKDPDSEVTKT